MQGITIRRLGPEDLDVLCAVPGGLFDGPVDRVQSEAFLADPMNVIVLAFDDDLAVSMATGTVLRHPDKQPSLFINEVGTRDSHLRRGIGRKVSLALMEIARARGCESVWLATEPDNASALGLYRSMAGKEVHGVYFSWDDVV